jgi:hypothetical protein
MKRLLESRELFTIMLVDRESPYVRQKGRTRIIKYRTNRQSVF